MYYILELNNSIFNIFSDQQSGIVQLYKLSNLSSNLFLKIFNEGCVIGYYSVINNKIFYTTSDNNIIVTNEITDLPFEVLLMNQKKNSKIEPKNQNNNFKNKKTSSEINVRLPPINTEINISSENFSNELEEIDLEVLEKKIEELNKLKEKEIDDLENLNENLHNIENKHIEEKSNVDAEKNKLKRDKEKWEEFKNIFNADKKIYRIMKEQINNEQIDEIPELFEKKYPIFAALDENNILDTKSEIYEYIKLLPENENIYIPKDSLIRNLFDNDNPVTSISLTELKESNNNFETTIDTDDEDD